jgi:N-acetylglutamate synthase-like GNAT family acetyltransferase
MQSQIKLLPISQALDFADQPLSWSLKMWGEGKSEFSAQDWHDFYQRAKSANYESWDHNRTDQELLFMAISEIDGKSQVVASIALCDFDDLEEFRRYKPWIAAFIVRQDLRGKGVGERVLKLVEAKAIDYGIKLVYLWTEGEREFYAKRGYEYLDTLNKENRRIDLMQKRLVF